MSLFCSGASLIVGGLFSRFGQSPIVGYLLAGMLLGGPGSIHAVKSQHEIEAVAELGVALLLFSLGLEFSIERLKKLGAQTLAQWRRSGLADNATSIRWSCDVRIGHTRIGCVRCNGCD